MHDPERFRRIDAVFDAALDLPADERNAWLDRECAQDTGLRAEVEMLLASVRTAESMFGENVAEFAAPLLYGLPEDPDDDPPLRPGAELGSWRVLNEIGRGGMGAVYLAERADGAFERRVAIKVVKRGMDTAEVLRRFREERRILAALDHPNVARLVDGGATADGHPFIVMEHVEGERIDRWCDEAKLDVRARVELFRDVCEAVHQAHRRLVVHRDVKPSNVLVTRDGVPKLLDFGIAKLLEDDAADLTVTGARLLTPEYAAPEQTAGQPVTTATDVYGLGRLLHELLSKAPAADRPRASLLGELDTIVQRAMAAEPGRRYGSALQLTEDLDRWLQGLPVKARPDSLGYRASKFVRRNPLAVSVAAAFLLLLVAFAASMAAAQRRTARALARAETERDTAEEVASLLEGLFDAGDPTALRAERLDTFRVAALLDRSSARVRIQLAGKPEVQARLLRVIGDAYRGLGFFDSAGSVLRSALEVQRTTGDSLALASALSSLAVLSLGLGQGGEAELYLREALALRRVLLPPSHAAIIGSLANLAAARQEQADFEEAAHLYDEALAALDASAVVDSTQLSSILNGRAQLAQRTGDYETGNRLVSRILALDQAQLGAMHPRIALDLNNVAFMRMRLGRLAEADSLFAHALEVTRSTVGEEHPMYIDGLAALANVRAQRGRRSEALGLFEESLSRKRASRQGDAFGLSITLSQYAEVLVADGDSAAAERAMQESASIALQAFGPAHPNYAVPLLQLSRLQCDRASGETVLAGFTNAMEVLQSAFPPTHPRVLDGRYAHAVCLMDAGKLAEAEVVLVGTFEAVGGNMTGPVPPPARRFASQLALLENRRGRPDRAAAWHALADSAGT